MSTRTVSSMTPRGELGPFSPSQRPTGNYREDSMQTARGYAVARESHGSNHGIDDRRNIVHSNHHERHRDYQHRRGPNDYRPSGPERGPYNDRNKYTDMGQGYDDRPRSYNRRPINNNGNVRADRNERHYNDNYHDSREFSSNTANSNSQRPMIGEGGSYNYDDRRRPVGRVAHQPGNDYRDLGNHQSINRNMDSNGRYDFGHERERRYDRIDHERQYPRGDRNIVQDHYQNNDSDRHPSRFSTGREDRGIEYNDRRSARPYEQLQRHNDDRWQSQADTSRLDRYSNSAYDRDGYSNHRGTGTVDTRPGDWNRGHQNLSEVKTREFVRHDRVGQRHSDDYLVASECAETTDRDARWNQRENGDDRFHRNYSHREEQRNWEHGISDINTRKDSASNEWIRDSIRSSSAYDNKDSISQSRKRPREDESASNIATITKASKKESESSQPKKIIPRHVYKYKSSSASTSSMVQKESSKAAEEPEMKKISTDPSAPPKAKACSNSAKPNNSNMSSKPAIKLGIPMKWLKPQAKPKPVKKIQPKVADDTSKSTNITLKQTPTKKSSPKPSLPPNRLLVTDSSEGSSIMSSKNDAKIASSSLVQHSKTTVPAAIVTKKSKASPKSKIKHKSQNRNINGDSEKREDEWDSEAESEESDGNSSESDIDDDEVTDRASKVHGVPASPSSIPPTHSADSPEGTNTENLIATENSQVKSPKLKIRLSTALKLKLNKSIQPSKQSKDLSIEDSNISEAALKKLERKKKEHEKLKAFTEKINEQPEFDHKKAKMEIEEERRKREEAKPLTNKEIRRILQDDTFSGGGNQNNWVRRSRRQPNMALLNSKGVRMLVDKLKYNDIDMVVLKMKKYINDPNTPCAVIDAILNAMEENTNCEALYIQNFNLGMRDDQVMHLLRILQQPSCKIWCLNIGENYNVTDSTWEKFTKGLIHTKITHMYASEHTITSAMKDEIRFTIRENRKKHDRHINPNNLDVIIQCTHCWWNPINAKSLRPFLKKKGYEHVLKDKEAQGLQGSKSMAPTA